MKRYTVTIEHITYAYIQGSFPVYAASLDDAWSAAYRECGDWFRVLTVK